MAVAVVEQQHQGRREQLQMDLREWIVNSVSEQKNAPTDVPRESVS